MPIVFLLMHILAFVGILTFRRYIVAAHCKVEEITKQRRWCTDTPDIKENQSLRASGDF